MRFGDDPLLPFNIFNELDFLVFTQNRNLLASMRSKRQTTLRKFDPKFAKIVELEVPMKTKKHARKHFIPKLLGFLK